MNAKQRAKLVKLIKNDCELMHKYADSERRGYCVIGSMLSSCGYEDRKLVALGSQHVYRLPKAMLDRLRKVFGVTLATLRALQQANDSVDSSVESRRLKVLASLSD